MKGDLRFVFDTNALISAALIRASISRQAFDSACQQGTLLLSWPIIAELQEKLSLKKFDKYISENYLGDFEMKNNKMPNFANAVH